MLLTWSRGTVALVAAVLLSGCSEEQSSFGADQPAVDACIQALEQRGAVPEDRVTRSLKVVKRGDAWDVQYAVEDASDGGVSSLGCSVARDSSSPAGVGSVTVVAP